MQIKKLSTNAQRDSVDGMECKLFRHTYHPYHMHKQNMGLYVLTRELAPADEQVVIALEQYRMVGKALATEVSFSEAEALYHRSHRAIQDEDALLDNIV
mgnify:CR=1 FL=1